MNLQDSINQFYYDMTVSDLRQLHGSAGTDLSYNSVMYLDVISYQSEQGGCTVSTLARTLGISKAAATLKVNELAAQGLVLRHQSRLDRRVHHLHVSDAVAQVLAAYDRPLERAVQRIERDYAAGEIETFCKILQTFCKEFSEESQHAAKSTV